MLSLDNVSSHILSLRMPVHCIDEASACSDRFLILFSFTSFRFLSRQQIEQSIDVLFEVIADETKHYNR
jgi:hypothetical protein